MFGVAGRPRLVTGPQQWTANVARAWIGCAGARVQPGGGDRVLVDAFEQRRHVALGSAGGPGQSQRYRKVAPLALDRALTRMPSSCSKTGSSSSSSRSIVTQPPSASWTIQAGVVVETDVVSVVGPAQDRDPAGRGVLLLDRALRV